MPIFELVLRATLENVATVRAPEDFALRVKFVCGGCNEAWAAFSVFTAADAVDIPGSKGTAQLVQKCKLCSRVCTADVLPRPPSGGAYTAADSEARKGVALLRIEARGMAPQAWQLGPGWDVASAGSASWVANLDDDL